MAKSVKVCRYCRWIEATELSKCPECGLSLETTQYSELYWNKCSEEKKKSILESFKTPDEAEREKALAKQEEETRHAEFLAQRQSIIVTTTPGVEGRKIKKYLGLVSGAATYNAGGLLGGGYTNSGQAVYFDMSVKTAQNQMKQKAAEGTEAIVGVQTSIGSSAAANQVIVTLTGTMVQLEPEE